MVADAYRVLSVRNTLYTRIVFTSKTVNGALPGPRGNITMKFLLWGVLACLLYGLNVSALHTSQRNCEDKRRDCLWSKNIDRCRTSTTWRKNCKNTCGLCDAAQEQIDCADEKNEECIFWGKSDRCRVMNETRMLCRLTCDLCNATPDQIKCRDTEKKGDEGMCLIWKLNGYCGEFWHQARVDCKLTCGICIPDHIRRQLTEGSNNPDCVDSEYPGTNTCLAWRKSGYCTRNPDARKRCRKTCGTCNLAPDLQDCIDGPVDAHVRWRVGYCNDWWQAGYCRTDPHTRKNCRLTCNTCGLDQDMLDCVDKNPSGHPHACTQWYLEGYCRTHSGTRDQCRVTCGTCGFDLEEIMRVETPTLPPTRPRATYPPAIWSPWSAWSRCSKSCRSWPHEASGTQTRVRACPIPLHCYGHYQETQYCNYSECPAPEMQADGPAAPIPNLVRAGVYLVRLRRENPNMSAQAQLAALNQRYPNVVAQLVAMMMLHNRRLTRQQAEAMIPEFIGK